CTDTPATLIYTLSLHDALPIYSLAEQENVRRIAKQDVEREREYGISKFAKDMLEVSDNLERCIAAIKPEQVENNPDLATFLEGRSEEHTSELQSRENLVCRLLL